MSSSKPSVAELRAVCQPADIVGRYSGEHWAGRLYGRRVSIYVTWALVRIGLSANAITVLMALIGAAGAALFAFRNLWAPITGVALIQLYLVLDCSDGEVARWRGTTGAKGIFLDRLGHYVVEATLFVAMGMRAAAFLAKVDTGPLLVLVLRTRMEWLFLGAVAALIHLLGKVETDLVHVARGKADLPQLTDEEETSLPRATALSSLRRWARAVPLYRLTGAVEASWIAVVVALIDEARGGAAWTEGFIIGALFVTALVFFGHLVMILASNRLR